MLGNILGSNAHERRPGESLAVVIRRRWAVVYDATVAEHYAEERRFVDLFAPNTPVDAPITEAAQIPPEVAGNVINLAAYRAATSQSEQDRQLAMQDDAREAVKAVHEEVSHEAAA